MKISDLTESLISNTQYPLEERYKFFNQRLFHNGLPDVKLSWLNDKNQSGITRAKTTSSGERQLIPGSITIELSSLFKRSMEVFDAILIHEMIHVYFYSINDFVEGHGSKFQQMAKRFSTQLGFQIPLTDSMKDAVSIGPISIPVCVMVLTQKTGKIIFKIISKHRWQEDSVSIKADARSMIETGDAKKVVFYSINTVMWLTLSKNMTDKEAFSVKDAEDLLADLENSGQLLYSIAT